MPVSFAVVSLWAEDVTTAAHFYRDVLGLKLQPHLHGTRPHFDVGGVHLTILQGRPVPAADADPQRFPLFALAVDDLNQCVHRLQAHGITLPWGIESGAGSRWAMFHDPAGNLIEVVESSRLPAVE